MSPPTANWSEQEDAALRRYWPDANVTIPEIGRRLGRSPGAVKARGHKVLKLGPKAIDRAANNVRHGYSEEMRKAVGRLRLEGLSIAEIRARLGVGRSFVTKNLRKQGVKKPRVNERTNAVEQVPALDAEAWAPEPATFDLRPKRRTAKRRPAYRPLEPRVIQLRPVTPVILARARQQIAKGVSVEDFADLFDVDAERLTAALEGRAA